MKIKSLSETNPYLRDKKLYEKLVTASVTSSTAIELGSVSPAIIKALQEESFPQLIFYPLDQK